MLDLTAEAKAYFDTLPYEVRLGFVNSNLTFKTLDDLKDYQETNLNHLDEILYERLPDPAIPSNCALDPLDSQAP